MRLPESSFPVQFFETCFVLHNALRRTIAGYRISNLTIDIELLTVIVSVDEKKEEEDPLYGRIIVVNRELTTFNIYEW